MRAIEPLQARFDALLERVYAEQKAQGKEVVAPVSNQEAQRVFGEALDALEQALQKVCYKPHLNKTRFYVRLIAKPLKPAPISYRV